MKNNFHHISVMPNEVSDLLCVKPKKRYIDATIGGGGHTREILNKKGVVLGIDQDQDAIEYVTSAFKDKIESKQLIVVNGNFKDIRKIAVENGFEKVNGILLDLGVSSYQMDASGRGFGIRKDEKLDMRMDKENKLSGFDVVNNYPLERLTEIFYLYGEEHNARKIAEQICETRKKTPIATTKELALLIEKIPHKNESIHPATRIFQAIRIEVNDEISVLRKVLQEGIDLLDSNGRIIVISFHSLEDRIVKQTFAKLRKNNLGNIITKKPLTATYDEVLKNKRSRSAKLRVFEKL